MIVITIPAYNEADTIAKVINDIKQESGLKDYIILVVDDGSTDRTAEVATKAGAVVHSHHTNLGLAEAFRTEMRVALTYNPELIVHTDADGQYLAKDIQKLIEKQAEGYDLVLGSRFAGTIESMPWLKRWGNRQFSKVLSKITKHEITDGQTGFRVFTPTVAKLNLRSNHTYTQEQILRANKEHFRIAEVPIYFAKREDKQSRLIRNPFEYATKAWINILRTYRDYEPLKFFGSVGLSFMGVALLLSLYILSLFFFVGFDTVKTKVPTLILIAIMFSTGLQILLFGFLADKGDI